MRRRLSFHHSWRYQEQVLLKGQVIAAGLNIDDHIMITPRTACSHWDGACFWKRSWQALLVLSMQLVNLSHAPRLVLWRIFALTFATKTPTSTTRLIWARFVSATALASALMNLSNPTPEKQPAVTEMKSSTKKPYNIPEKISWKSWWIMLFQWLRMGSRVQSFGVSSMILDPSGQIYEIVLRSEDLWAKGNHSTQFVEQQCRDGIVCTFDSYVLVLPHGGSKGTDSKRTSHKQVALTASCKIFPRGVLASVSAHI